LVAPAEVIVAAEGVLPPYIDAAFRAFESRASMVEFYLDSRDDERPALSPAIDEEVLEAYEACLSRFLPVADVAPRMARLRNYLMDSADRWM